MLALLGAFSSIRIQNKFMNINTLYICLLALAFSLPGALFAKDATGKAVDKAQELVNSKPPAVTPSGTKPAEPANPAENPAKPAEPGNKSKPEAPSKQETPTEPSKPDDPLKKGNPPEETPSGTKPAEPANPGENPATPAEPGDKEKPDTGKDVDDKNKPDNADKGEKDSKETKDKKDKADKGSKDKKNKPGKGGKSGGGKSGLSLPSGVPTPSGGGALLPAAGALGGGMLGGIFSGGKKDAAKEEKKEKPPKPAPNAAVILSETVKEVAPIQASTQAVAVEPLYSAGKGPGIAVINFEGEQDAEFSALLTKALSADLKVYNPKELAAKKYDPAAINRVSVRKIAAEIDVEYIVTVKVSKKSETLSIVSVFLREGKTGDIKMTDNSNLRSPEDLKAAAETVSGKIKERIKQ